MKIQKSQLLKFVAIALLVGVSVTLVGGGYREGFETSYLTVSFGNPWRTLHPGLQHTMVGDLLLSNQFEPLIASNERGTFIPLAAKSWTMTEDFTEFKFVINKEHRFSDGSYLSSNDFKRSWIEAFKLVPKSANSSVSDLLSMIKGSESFEATKTLEGIETPDSSTLIIKFKRPFRTALNHFRGTRFSAYKVDEQGKLIGTGKYIIEESSDPETVLLRPNPFHQQSTSLDPLKVVHISDALSMQALRDGTVDVLAYARGLKTYVSDSDEEIIGAAIGQDATHEVLNISSQRHSIFGEKRNRQAFQFMVHEAISRDPSRVGNRKYFEVDIQPFLRFQKGRISDEEAIEIVDEGRAYVAHFKQSNDSKPLLIYATESGSWIFELIEDLGLKVDDKSGIKPAAELSDLSYKSLEPDLIVGGFSVSNSDPDGIYHRLGKYGAIMLPFTYNDVLAGSLELGRTLLDSEKIDKHYQDFSRKFLREVPQVHLGFSKAVALFRKDRVDFNREILRRNEGHLDVFRKKR